MGKLSDLEKEKIAQGIRSLVQSDLSMGISTGSRIICHNCEYVEPPGIQFLKPVNIRPNIQQSTRNHL